MFAVGLFVAVFGGALLFAASKLYLKQREFLTHVESASGTIVDFEESIETNSRNGYERHLFYAPVFTFADRSGLTQRATSKTSSIDKPGYQIGQTVPIQYNRDHPDEAELDTFFASWGGAAILGGMGAVFVAGGGAMVMNGLRTMQRRGGKPNRPGPGGVGSPPRDPAILSGP